jgi:MGT family glycosyltransferase
MSVGEKIDIKNLAYGIGNIGGIPKNFMVYPYVPQLDVLKRADLFVMHGGMNSANEAIHYGVPVIVVPQSIEQMRVANRMAELGFGKKLDMKDFTTKTLRKTALNVLENPSYKEAINSMRNDIQLTHGEARAADEIEKYIKSK